MPFPYPPAYLALVAPFGLLPFPLAMAIWIACTFAFYLWAARRLIPRSGWLAAAFPAVYANATDGQNAFLTVGLFMNCGNSSTHTFSGALRTLAGSLTTSVSLWIRSSRCVAVM